MSVRVLAGVAVIAASTALAAKAREALGRESL